MNGSRGASLGASKLLGEDGIPNKSDKGHGKGLGWEDFEELNLLACPY